MRIAYNGDFVGNDESHIDGICLGGDHVAEHEFGIDPLKRAFGLDDQKIGLDKFRCTQFPAPFVMTGVVDKKNSMLVLFDAHGLDWVHDMSKEARNLRSMVARCGLMPYSDIPFVAAWDRHSFGILAWGDENVRKLKAVLQAWEDHDLCVMLSGSRNPFAPVGLCLIRASSYSQEEKDRMEQTDLKHRQLLEAAEKTGIAKELKEAGLGYYALEPEWTDFFKEPKYESEYPVIFFLNPEKQDRYSHGWFTVEELKQWIHGTGPIIKTQK